VGWDAGVGQLVRGRVGSGHGRVELVGSRGRAWVGSVVRAGSVFQGLAWLGRLVCWLAGTGDAPMDPSSRVMNIVCIDKLYFKFL
jgi:hypothetical protein